MSHVLRTLRRLRDARRVKGVPTGAAALCITCKTDQAGIYDGGLGDRTHEEIRGMDLSEPSVPTPVKLSEALPKYELEFYQHEENLVEFQGKSDIEYQAIVRRYSFVGGTDIEYGTYFSRKDAQAQWDFVKIDKVKCVNGMTAVHKKWKPTDRTLTPQRKIIACNGCNYWWIPAKWGGGG